MREPTLMMSRMLIGAVTLFLFMGSSHAVELPAFCSKAAAPLI